MEGAVESGGEEENDTIPTKQPQRIDLGNNGGQGNKYSHQRWVLSVAKRREMKLKVTTTMEEEKEEKEEMGFDGSGKTVVVGVRLDAQSKELLTWALVKVAEPGDRVVALHVLTKSSLSSDPDGNSPASMISIVKEFDSVLAVYKGFCNLKQIDLKLKICRGSSIRKVLVREVNGFGAAKVILGVTKCNRVIGSFSTSIAKYCVRKLPKECWVAAVNNGNIVFQREAAVQNSPRCTQSKEQGSNKANNSKFLNGSSGELLCLVSNRSGGSGCDTGSEGNLPSISDSSKQSCTICSTLSDPAREGAEKDSVPLVPVHDGETSPSSVIPSTHELLETRWPLIRRILHTKKTRTLEKTKSSVAQWDRRLPIRHSSSASVHPDRKLAKQCKNATGATEEDGTGIHTGNEENILKITKELEFLHEKYASTCRLFSYAELVNATSNFSSENLVGKGGSSHVYKGQFPDGRGLAVKILKQSEDVVKEFILEIEIITSLHHMNIISLVGFCFENHKLLLVYDFLARGSLEQNLHDVKDNTTGLGWAERCKVAVGVAEALNYLHCGSGGQPIIHRDVKSSNILLSDDFEPQLSDFGLATWESSSSTPLTCSDVAGTFGYLAPEYFVFGKVNEKIDVYAFGIVLLELLSGRKPIADKSPKGQQSLVMWARPFLQSGKSKQMLDSSLGSELDDDQLESMVLAATLCVRRSPILRPKMALILKLLRGDDETIKWARSQFSTVEELEGMDEESVAYTAISDIQSHLNLALLDVEDDMLSASSASHSVDYITSHSSLDAYLQERWSRSSSFD